MAVELPKGAEGREIPLDTEIPYDENGNEYEVYYCRYPVRRTIPRRKRQVVIMGYIAHDVPDLYPTPPGSREKPDEDLQAVGVCGDSPELEDPVCAYAHDIGKKCAECKPYTGDRTVNMCKDTVPRTHKLGGEGR